MSNNTTTTTRPAMKPYTLTVNHGRLEITSHPYYFPPMPEPSGVIEQLRVILALLPYAVYERILPTRYRKWHRYCAAQQLIDTADEEFINATT